MFIIGISLKFKHIADNALKIAELLVTNQNILRYINYNTNSPLDLKTIDGSGKKVSQPDLTLSLKDSGILLTPYNEDILNETKVKVFISPLKPKNNTGVLVDDVYVVNIVCPIDYYVLDEKYEFRPFNIAYEICQELDNKNVAGVGKCNVFDWNNGKLNTNYCITNLFISVTNATGVAVQ